MLLKRSFIIFISIILLLGVTGCMDSKKVSSYTAEKESSEVIQEKVLDHLRKKYEKEFQCLAFEGTSALKDYYTLILSERDSEKKSDEFKAFYYPEAKDQFKDAYYGLKLREIITHNLALSSVFEESNHKVFIKFKNTTFSEELTFKSSLEDAIQEEGKIDSVIYMFGTKNISIDSIISELKSNGISGTMFFYEIDKNTFSNLSYETYEEIISDIISKKIRVYSESKTSID